MLAAVQAGLRSQRSGTLLITLLHAISLAIFVQGFLLTRVQLDARNTIAVAAGPAPRSKLVWLIIDSLRYDFVVSDGRYSCAPGRLCHQRQMPYLNNLTSQEEVARAFRFIADPPTTTTQRLKSLVTGGLPSFFDVSNSFTAGHVSEDNLVDQLHSAGKRLAFLGDTTWSQLFPHQFSISAPFPCFNVKDLHTVDDGVWELLLPMIRQTGQAGGSGSGGWDVLVAHYLGVDHAGHTFGVDSKEMVAKLQQMDDHIGQVVEELARGAGPGGEFEHALLLVSGDHGQTLTGDHGGGSPEEVDSALVAIDPAALHRLRHSSSSSRGCNASPCGSSTTDSNSVADGCGKGAVEEEAACAGPALPETPLWGPAPCRRSCSCGPDGKQCVPDLPQVDLSSTLASLLGVPIPFGNIGKVSTELWGFAAAAAALAVEGQFGGGGRGVAKAREAVAGDTGRVDAGLAVVLRGNAEQVHNYLNKYASTPGAAFSSAALRGINSMYDALEDQQDNGTSLTDQNQRYLTFLEAAAALAREQWTQFSMSSMLLGLALFAATLGIHALATFGDHHPPSPFPARAASAAGMAFISSNGHGIHVTGQQHSIGLVSSLSASLVRLGMLRWGKRNGSWPVPTLGSALAALTAVHVLGIFSFFFLLSEGSKMSQILAAMSALLVAAAALHQGPSATTTASSPPTKRRSPLWVLLLGAVLLVSNASMAALGLASHSGLAFWHRLTVHPEPAQRSSSAAAGQEGATTAATAAPLVWTATAASFARQLLGAVAGDGIGCLLPIACLAALAIGTQERLSQLRGGSGSLMLRLQQALMAAAFTCVAAYHGSEQLIQQGTLPDGASAGQIVQLATSRLYCESTMQAWKAAAAAAAARLPLRCWLGAALWDGGQQLLAVPLRLLLPQLTYSLCCTALLLLALQQVQPRLHCIKGKDVCTSRAGGGKEPNADLARMAEAAVGLQGPLLAATLQVSDNGTPLLLLLGAAQLWVVMGLLRARLQQVGNGESLPAMVGMEAAAILAVMQVQVFFTTGHLCEFAGLEYLAGFVGFDEFHLLRSAALLIIHTFGAMLLVVLALPVALYTLALEHQASDVRTPHQGQQQQQQPPANQWWHRAVLAFLFVRSCAAFAATLSAAVQRRHLYAWALFAPKFAFEAAFLLGTDVLLFLLSMFI